MFKVLKPGPMCCIRNILAFPPFKSTKLHLPRKCTMCEVIVWHSTLPKQNVDPKLHFQKKNKKMKLKPKPYDELLRILEVRENFLRKHNPETVKTHKAKKIEKDYSEKSRLYCKEIFPKPTTTDENKSAIKKQAEASNEKKKKKMGKKKPKLTPKQEDIEKATKHTYAMNTLKSYIQVCINASEVEKAQEALEYYMSKMKTDKLESDMNVDSYNMLIMGWAEKGKLDKVKQIFTHMSTANISPNLQSYAGYLECIARSKFIDVAEITRVVDEMKSKGLSHRDILLKCIFVGDQREKVIETLGFIDPSLQSTTISEEVSYACSLLEKLNDKNYEKEDRHPNFCFNPDDILEIASKQMAIEENYSLKIKSVDAVEAVSNKVHKSRKYLKECEEMWREKLSEKLKRFTNLERHRHGYNKPSIYPYLAVIDTDIFVNLLLQEVRFLAETSEFYSPNEKVLFRNLGVKVMNHYFVWLNKKHKISDKVLFLYQKFLSYLLNPKLCAQYSPREYWEFLKVEYSSGPTIDVAVVEWPHGVLTYIGKYLYDILRHNISFNANCVRHKNPSKVMSQAFYVAYEQMDVKLSKQIRTHPLLCKLYRDARLDHLVFDATLVPMMSPPKPWVKHDSGGLLLTGTPFIRLPGVAVHQNIVYSKVPSQSLNPCFDSLNSLSIVPWTINKPILDLVINVFQKGGSKELDIPLNLSSFPPEPEIHSSMTNKEKSAIRRQIIELNKEKSEMTSLWYDCLYKLSIANHFRDMIFWFPHNLDFRGRVYPTPPHFNHLGSDMARSILLFAGGEPLGPNGLDWMKIHLINLTGFKKRDPHAERLKFANGMIPEIFDSADYPFEGNQWWKTSDKPWQTLACCKELANALRHPKPEEYISHFPVHQDGSCNGLQHYAALGRDDLGAIEVNLHPSEAPHDVYSGVAALVEKERLKDAADGSEIAKQLEGFVRRKVVKQTVMTFVYGVTAYGARLQILKQLKDMPDYPEKYYQEGATYLMKKTFLSIKEMFTATKQIQDWFTECAEHITRISGDTLEWITPLGLPVIQPYHKETAVRNPKFCISRGKETISQYSSKFEPYQLPNVRKQKNAFAPNFIHSLDSSHMMLTSLFCQRKGITFVSVHDCYWTHASTVQIMNKICRDQFVSLHKEPILENLSASFIEKYSRVIDEKIHSSKCKESTAILKLKDVLNRVPQRGVFDLKRVLESEYFFS